MNNTKDKVKDGTKEFLKNGKSKFDEAFNKIDLIKYISKAQDEISKNSTESSIDEYNSIYMKDEVYLSLISDLEMYRELRSDEFAKISSKENISQEERDSILNYVKSELDPRIEGLLDKIDTRRYEINSDREVHVKESDEKKTRRKNTMLTIALGASGVALVAHPKTRKIVLDNGKKLAVDAIKNGTKLL
ncbi:hypothetical protein UMC2_37281 [[Clostridium] sordellii]|uniref:hypothetical protein n=1 Tax=Paraclostridium sordellii TaxID=1505 RepID=UPI0005442700|nr:hypothetical protein [Paeniclostridium sordellii]CEK34517.1 hypothetical protein UMC2_37281 [[Clostridium] sordellii] [Paeniclostridium sordellii]